MSLAWNDLVTRARRAVPLNEDNFFLILAVVIGVLSGLAVVCFRRAIQITTHWLFGAGQPISHLRLLLVPSVAGLILAAVVILIFPAVRGSGVNQTKSAVYIYNGYISFRTVIGKFLTCVLAIGSGQSLGPEDPSLQMGAGIASILGRNLQLSREKLRLLAPVGAAAGLAAAFNAPIAAVIFVIEEIIGTWTAGILGAVILAAASSVVVMRLFLGAAPMFRIPEYKMVHPQEMLAYVVLGIIGGIASLVFSKLLTWMRGRVRALPTWTEYFQPAIAGLAIGVIAFKFPQVMGAGYEQLDQAMTGHFLWHVLALLVLLKILATVFSVSSGAPGGMFAPTLFIGGMLGAAVGTLQARFFPAYTGPVGAYALVGMGTLFAGFLRVPMTSVFMVLEISGNYSIILPVMVSNTIAYWVSRRFQHLPIFDVLTAQDGLNLPSMEEHRESRVLRVEDAMQPPPGVTLRTEETVGGALARANEASENTLLVSSPAGRWAVVKRSELEEAVRQGKQMAFVGDATPGIRVSRLHADQPLELALRFLRDSDYLPVVHRAEPRTLLGVVSLANLLTSYRRVSTGEATATGPAIVRTP
ncbi:MAG: chloride channel protein [Candidatus Acidiferrales bacterium]